MILLRSDGGQHRGDAGSDILPEQDEYRPVQGRRVPLTASAWRMPTEAEEDWMMAVNSMPPMAMPAERVGEGGHQGDEHARTLWRGTHGVAHHIHADEEDAEAGDDAALSMLDLLLSRQT